MMSGHGCGVAGLRPDDASRYWLAAHRENANRAAKYHISGRREEGDDALDRRFLDYAFLQYHASDRQGGEIGIHSGLKTRRR